jgi:hypothetical protein
MEQVLKNPDRENSYIQDPLYGGLNEAAAGDLKIQFRPDGTLHQFIATPEALQKLVTDLKSEIHARAGPMAQRITDSPGARTDLGVKIVEHWTPLNGPGPLGPERAATFRGSTYTEKILQKDLILYRAYGSKAGELGKYWTREKPRGAYQTAIDSAIDPKWGNTLDEVSTIRVPKGTKIYEGYASSQGGLIGGGNQIVIEKVDPLWRIR